MEMILLFQFYPDLLDHVNNFPKSLICQNILSNSADADRENLLSAKCKVSWLSSEAAISAAIPWLSYWRHER